MGKKYKINTYNQKWMWWVLVNDVIKGVNMIVTRQERTRRSLKKFCFYTRVLKGLLSRDRMQRVNYNTVRKLVFLGSDYIYQEETQ